jgi:hypothetical protein
MLLFLSVAIAYNLYSPEGTVKVILLSDIISSLLFLTLSLVNILVKLNLIPTSIVIGDAIILTSHLSLFCITSSCKLPVCFEELLKFIYLL